MKNPLNDRLMRRLPPCIRITEQLSAAYDLDLTAGEKFLVWMHVRLCIHCRRFSRQLDLISKAMEDARNEARLMSASKIPPLSYTAREKIKSAIRSGAL
jgi:hypothetical protein